MANYVGVDCPVCDEKFTASDDVVVCPICGAPHHRHCYMEKNRCAFEDEHITGKEWKRPVREGAETKTVAACRRCGSQNPQENVVCQVCGVPLGRKQQEYRREKSGPADSEQWTNRAPYNIDIHSLLYGGLSPDEKIAGESVRDIADYVGNNSAYFLIRFKMFGQNGFVGSFNLGALVFNFLYFFYRKMYKIGALMLVLFLLGQAPAFLYMAGCWPHFLGEAARQNDAIYRQLFAAGIGIPAQEADMALVQLYQSLMSVARIVIFAVGASMSMFANYFYFKKTISDVGAIRMRSEGDSKGPPRSVRLQLAGRVNMGGTLAVVALLFTLLAVASYFAVLYGITMFPS